MSADKDAYLKRITKGAVIIFVGMIIGRALGYFSQIFIARFFGAESYGLFSLASAVLGIVIIIVLLGMPIALSRFIPYYKGKKDPGRIKGTVYSSFKIVIPIVTIASVIIFLFSNDIAIHVFNEPGFAPLLKIFTIVFPLVALFNIFLFAFLS